MQMSTAWCWSLRAAKAIRQLGYEWGVFRTEGEPSPASSLGEEEEVEGIDGAGASGPFRVGHVNPGYPIQEPLHGQQVESVGLQGGEFSLSFGPCDEPFPWFVNDPSFAETVNGFDHDFDISHAGILHTGDFPNDIAF